MTPELRRLADEHAIVAVAVRYCWALDTRDWELLRDVFLPDATADLATRNELEGVDAIAARCRAALEPLDASQHFVSTHQVDVDGDAATHRCHLHAQHTRRGVEGGENYMVGGRYVDRFVRTPAGWRIANRQLVIMWTEGNPEAMRR
ncbi:MAG: nuclear transport factor 2 family protein [Ilumatobacteraceae bacterium]